MVSKRELQALARVAQRIQTLGLEGHLRRECRLLRRRAVRALQWAQLIREEPYASDPRLTEAKQYLETRIRLLDHRRLRKATASDLMALLRRLGSSASELN